MEAVSGAAAAPMPGKALPPVASAMYFTKLASAAIRRTLDCSCSSRRCSNSRCTATLVASALSTACAAMRCPCV